MTKTMQYMETIEKWEPTREKFERETRQMVRDYYRHAISREDYDAQMFARACMASDYGMNQKEYTAIVWACEKEFAEFYADTETVEALMRCNH